MAKRTGAGKGGIVVAKEIRALIEANNEIKGPEVMAALREKFPKVKFNENSCQVSYTNTRKKMGLSRTVVKRPEGVKMRVGRPMAPWRSESSPIGTSSDAAVTLGLLQAAKVLLQASNGDLAVATQALKQIASLQMN